MKRLVIVTGVLLLVGFIFSLRSPWPGIYSSATAPVPADEIWTLNPE